jgi:hypothetical protein
MSRPPALLAPGADAPSEAAHCPAVHERLAPPETRLEYLDGVELFAAPADPPHARLHATLAYVLEAHAAPGYLTAVDMLTRTDEASDFAPDASVFPATYDARTGGRKLEELAFEISNRQGLGVATRKARELARRGVRRVFCLRVGQGRLLEWSREADGWQVVADEAQLDDRCFVRPVPVRVLVGAASADEAVVAALRARGVPALEAAVAEGEARGRAEGEAAGEARGRAEGEAAGEARGRAAGLRAAVVDLCEVLGIALDDERRARLAASGADDLEALRLALKQHRRWPDDAEPPR